MSLLRLILQAAGCALLWSVKCSSLGLGSLPSCTAQMPQFTGGRISMSCLSFVSFETFSTAVWGSYLCLTCSLFTFSCGRVLLPLQGNSVGIEKTGKKVLHQICVKIKNTPVAYYQQKKKSRRAFYNLSPCCLFIFIVQFPWAAVWYLCGFCLSVCFCSSKGLQRYCWQVWLWWQHFASGG